MTRLLGRVALITGAARPVGNAVVSCFSAAGITVIALDDDVSAIDASAIAAGVHGDPACPDAVGEAVAVGIERFGRIDMLFTGVPTLEAALAGARHALTAMGARGGSIVNLADAPGSPTDGYESHAAAARHGGIVALTRSMAATYAGHGIRCNAVCLPAPAAHGWPGRRSSLRDLATTALHLSSPHAAFLTGTVVEPEPARWAA